MRASAIEWIIAPTLHFFCSFSFFPVMVEDQVYPKGGGEVEQSAQLIIDGKTYELPLVMGAEGERALDISRLRRDTGLITLDPGYANTASCMSGITFMDGQKGILRYRGYPIEQLAEHSSFVETSYLLMNGELPSQEQINAFTALLNDHSLVREDMLRFFESYPAGTPPMDILLSMMNALRPFYPEIPETYGEEDLHVTFARILSKFRTMAAVSYRISRGLVIVFPKDTLSYGAHFLHMMFHCPASPYVLDNDMAKGLDAFWILHADHEQNCSTAAVRLIGSARVSLYTAISAGICALMGPLHGGTNRAVIEMLMAVQKSGGDVRPFIARAKDKKDPFRLMGFGNRVYKTYDPRARIMQKVCDRILSKMKTRDPLLDIARRLEDVALQDPYFIDHHLYPNLDFYSGIFLRLIGIPLDMFTAMFAIGRLPGWISQWKEGMEDPMGKLHRPRQIYIGPRGRDYV